MPGRAFTRRLYSFTAGALLPHHHVRVNQEMRLDLSLWLQFLQDPTIYARPFIDYQKWNADQLSWYTDASKNYRLGFGGIFGENWVFARWSDSQDRSFSNFILEKDQY